MLKIWWKKLLDRLLVKTPKKFIGWYDPEQEAAGDCAVYYWNGVIDRWGTGDFSLAGYLLALDKMLAQTPYKVFINLPYWDVSGQYSDKNILTSWWVQIIKHIDYHPQVLGYYLFDEPEIWGEKEITDKPALPLETALYLNKLVKKHSKKLTLSVAVDFKYYLKRYGFHSISDIFGFDAYRFVTQEKVNLGQLGYKIGSKEERQFITQFMLGWKQFLQELSPKELAFVNQGSGYESFRPDGSGPYYDQFGQRDMLWEEYVWFNELLRREFPQIKYHLMWSWFYSSPSLRELANKALIAWKNPLEISNKKK